MKAALALLAQKHRLSGDQIVDIPMLEGEAFDVGESIDRRLLGDPFDVGFNKVVLFQ
jgi:hypothetical protein